MNASPNFIIWWKEIRAALPVWLGALFALWLVSIKSLPLPGNDHALWQSVIFLTGSVILCSLIYTREFHDRTLLLQFLQPVSRMTVLGRKFVVAFLLQTSFWLLYWNCFPVAWQDDWTAIGFTGVVSLLAVSSVCIWGMLTRNTLSTMVVSFVIPLVLTIILMSPIENLAERITANSPQLDQGTVAFELLFGALTVYALVCAGLGVLLWSRLQLPGEAGAVSPMDVRVTARFLGEAGFRQRAPWRALLRKELGLLRHLYWIAGIFLLAELVSTVVDLGLTRAIAAASQGLQPGQFLSQDSGLIWWQSALRAMNGAFYVLMLALVPLLSGALAFAEENYLGTRVWERCHPVHFRRQWAVKLATSLAVNGLLGLLLPALVAALYTSLPTSGLQEFRFGNESIVQLTTLNLLLFGAAAWSATGSRNTMAAVTKAFLTLVLFSFLYGNVVNAMMYGNLFGPQVRNPPDWRIAAGLLAFLTIGATLLNFRVINDASPRRWFIQALVFAVALLSLTLPFLVGQYFSAL